jgi:hypothetical protein
MKCPSGVVANLEALERFWRRESFHDMNIEEVSALNRRVVIRLQTYTLVITGASELKRCELPAAWLYDSITQRPGGFLLDVETETGRLKVAGTDVRLLRNSDLAILIPPIDA